MPSTHLSLHYHVIFSTKDRYPWIADAWRPRLHGYLGGILRNLDAAPLAVGGVRDHVHLLFGLKATHRVADVIRSLKASSSGWVKQGVGTPLFAWQDGYAALTVGHAQLAGISEYVQAQERHHAKKTFQQEYLEILHAAGVTFDDRFLW